eukprot:5104741-Amphidinium_carterae.1
MGRWGVWCSDLEEGETAPAAGGAADDPAPAAEAADAGAADEGDGKARGAGGRQRSATLARKGT